jgi:hypothetical protein
MEPTFNPRCFKVSSNHSEVDHIVVERDGIGWKMDVIGSEHDEWPNGDTYQDTLDELMPFLAAYADHNSVRADFETGEK